MKKSLDHRLLADEMELYFIDDIVGAGLPLFLPNGASLRELVIRYVSDYEQKLGYLRVSSPPLAKKEMYEKSGHLAVYKKNMFPEMKAPGQEIDYFLRPMNCPHHHRIYSRQQRSYRELPFRIAEFGQVFRYENSGSLRGLSRARSLCQNDGHIYLDKKQAQKEIDLILTDIKSVFEAFGISQYQFQLSLGDPQSDDFVGEKESWSVAEDILRQSLKGQALDFQEVLGEGAFYGPKIDVQFQFADGSKESIASIQIDFNSANNFNLYYVNANGAKEKVWVIHRALIGSVERFISALLESHQGRLPGWLSPIQVLILPIGDVSSDYLQRLEEIIKGSFRLQIDKSSGSLSKKLRKAHQLRPYLIGVVGEKEVNSQSICFRRGSADISIEENQILDYIRNQIAMSVRPVFSGLTGN